MNDDTDVLSRLVAFHDHIAVPAVPVVDDVQRGRRRVRRNRALVSSGVAVAVAGIVAAASLIAGGAGDAAPQPATPTPSPTRVNGEITTLDKYVRATELNLDWRGFDQRTQRAIYVAEGECQACFDRAGSVRVVSGRGPVATLVCGTHLICRGLGGSSGLLAALGPGRDEVTVGLRDRTLRVHGYDGALRRTIDLTRTLGSDETVGSVAWSPDGRVLAVVSGRSSGGVWAGKVRLVDADGRARLAYATRYRLPGDRPPQLAAGFDAVGTASLVGWSPDGAVLLLDVDKQGGADAGRRIVAIRPASPGPMEKRTLYRYNRHWDGRGHVAWSADGTRIAVRGLDEVVEVSASDGRVLARHPYDGGWLVWPGVTR